MARGATTVDAFDQALLVTVEVVRISGPEVLEDITEHHVHLKEASRHDDRQCVGATRVRSGLVAEQDLLLRCLTAEMVIRCLV